MNTLVRRSIQRFWIAGVVLLAIAAILRLWDIASRPGFDWDESVYANVGENLATSGRLEAKTEYNEVPEPYLYHPPFYFWLLAGWFRLFGSGITEARTMAALSSLIVLVLLLGFLRKQIGNWALLAVVLIAVDGWMVFSNRVSWIENVMMPIGIAALWVYLNAYRRMDTRLFALAGILIGFVTVFKHVGLYFWVAVLIHWLITREQAKRHWVLVGCAAAMVASYIISMTLAFGNDFWRESGIQLIRIAGLRESRGALNELIDFVVPLTQQYRIFAMTVLLTVAVVVVLVIRALGCFRNRSVAALNGHTLLFAWALSALTCFAVLQLRLPHYFMMIVVPLYSYLVAEVKRLYEYATAHCSEVNRPLTLRPAIIASVVVAVILGASLSGALLRLNDDSNALRETATWVKANLPPDARVIAEEPVGTAIGQPYCKIWRAAECEKSARYLITYVSTTQDLPNSLALYRMIGQGAVEAEFVGFKERITVYKLPQQRTAIS